MPLVSAGETRRRDLLARIQEDLAGSIKNDDRTADAYIHYQDIEKAWAGRETILHALYPANLSDTEVIVIRERLLRFLSAIVYTGAHDILKDFRATFLVGEGKLRYSDRSLPLNDQNAPNFNFGGIVHRKRFLHEQYLFIPEVIQESSTIQVIDDRRILPFESVSRDLFAGAYGTVDKVGISSHHLRKLDSGTYPEVKYVACKRFHAQPSLTRNDSQRELENLQILKESITHHSNIRLHLAILFHRGQHLILLPWADHLDLELFLLEGHDFSGEKIYPFSTRFPRIKPGAMLNDICTQMHHIAHAIEWLHRGINTQGPHRNRIRFAHMDLKPNNILIDNDDGSSTVGKWVLTDFGISAFKEDDEPESTNLVSVRDFYQNLTINTTPRRDPGAYQPPEVEHETAASRPRRNMAKRGSAGRRGDIWSFACIFSEVLAFSLGQAELVKEFRRARKGRYRNDYFYESNNQTLRPDNANTSYVVRPQISDWLRGLSKRYTFPNQAIDCCVETIQRILVVDGSKRPRAHELERMLNHVAHHVNPTRAPGFPPNCPLDFHSPVPSPQVSEPAVSNDPVPSIKRTDTIEEEDLFNRQEMLDPSLGGLSTPHANASGLIKGNEGFRAAHSLRDPEIARHSSPDITALVNTAPSTSFHDTPLRVTTDAHFSNQPREDSFHEPSKPSPSQRNPSNGLGIYPDGTPSLPDTTSTPVISRPSTRESRRGLHGITINPSCKRKCLAPVQDNSPQRDGGKSTCFHLCRSGAEIAYLRESKRSQYEVCLYSIGLSDQKVHKKYDDLPISNRIPLPDSVSWQHVKAASSYIVTWGNGPGGTKQIYMTDQLQSKIWNSSESKWLSTLITIAVSQHGSVAFVCSKMILYTIISKELSSNTTWFQEKIYAKEDHSFTHAAFNEEGTLLYAWEYGRPDDCLSVWRIRETDKKLVIPVDMEGRYASKQQGSPVATLIPYNSHHGCVIRAQGDTFFPAQIRSTQRGSTDKLEKKVAMLPNTAAACMYGDHSLLVVEKGFMHTRIWEHQIIGGGMHFIDVSKEPIVELKYIIKKDTQIRVVSVPDSEDLMIVLCTLAGTVIMIPFVAEERPPSMSITSTRRLVNS